MLHDGRVIHFTMRERKKKKFLALEVFETDGRLLGYGKVDIANYPAASSGEPFYFWAHTLDDQDRLYVSRASDSGAPMVSVYRLVYEVVP